LAVFALLLGGVITLSGTKYLHFLALYFCSFIIFYWLIFKLGKRISIQPSEWNLIPYLRKYFSINLVVFASLLIIVLHFIYLKGIPAIEGLYLNKLSEVVKLRRAITEDAPSWINYVTSWNIRGVLPFMLALLYLKGNRKLYWIYFSIAVIYSFALMQKSIIMYVLIPIGIVSVYDRKWLYTLKFIITSILVIFSLTYIQNVQLRGGINDIKMNYEKEPTAATLIGKLALGLKRRVILVPGKMVVKWFDHIPKDKPFLYGNGFKIFSKLSGETYHDYARELYPYVYKENAKHGLVGSVNVASFMRGYSNFGQIGLIISALFLAIILVFVEMVFKNNRLPNIAFNTFPIVFLSSTSLSTILITGGWSLTILLFLMFKDDFNQNFD
jgi:hypothetical protein